MTVLTVMISCFKHELFPLSPPWCNNTGLDNLCGVGFKIIETIFSNIEPQRKIINVNIQAGACKNVLTVVTRETLVCVTGEHCKTNVYQMFTTDETCLVSLILTQLQHAAQSLSSFLLRECLPTQ